MNIDYSAYPTKLIFLFSGKRKSGKDFVVEKLNERIKNNEKAVTIRLSAPIKKQYAEDHQLDYEKLLDASDYKEKYRVDMIQWSENKRKEDSGYFIKPAIQMVKGQQYTVWIVSDMRRRSDLYWFQEHFPKSVVTVRVSASQETRIKRGWKFTENVDDAESECDLDSITDWNKEICNDGDEDSLNAFLNELMALVDQA